LKRLKQLLGALTPWQRQEVLAELGAPEAQDEVLSRIEARPGARPCCPHCDAPRVVRHGTAHGLRRYRCRECGRTFNALTGTPLARLRMKAKWLDQAGALAEGLTIHQVADRLEVAPSTAFRWRHRFLARPRTVQARRLTGIAEADETYFLRSNKGQRGLDRAPRKRGGVAARRGLSGEQVPVLIARDRAGQTANWRLQADHAASVAAALKPLLAPDVLLCTDGSSTLASAARQMGVCHRPVNVSAGRRVIAGVYHIQNVNAFDSRLKRWLRRFNGVATRYLESYLGWFRGLDRSATTPFNPASWLALSLGSQSCNT
jgi:transposase-like protein